MMITYFLPVPFLLAPHLPLLLAAPQPILLTRVAFFLRRILHLFCTLECATSCAATLLCNPWAFLFTTAKLQPKNEQQQSWNGICTGGRQLCTAVPVRSPPFGGRVMRCTPAIAQLLHT